MTDPHLHSIEVHWGTYFMVGHYLADHRAAVVQATHVVTSGISPQVAVTDVPTKPPTMPICHTLTGLC